MIQWLKNADELKELQKVYPDLLVLLFYGEFSEAAGRGLKELQELGRQREDIPVCIVDVQKVKGLHKEYGVQQVPTVLVLRKGLVTQSIEGVQSARFYEAILSGTPRADGAQVGEKKQRRIVVYSSPGCPACTTLKTYLRRHGLAFRTVDIAKDPRAAQALVRRSGQMAVPQTDIDGRLVVGFDKARLNKLLDISPERR